MNPPLFGITPLVTTIYYPERGFNGYYQLGSGIAYKGTTNLHYSSSTESSEVNPSDFKATKKASIPFLQEEMMKRRREKANDQIEKFYEIFRDLSFEISFTDALMLMPKFASTLKTLIGNKEKLSEMARTPLNENCSAVILNKLQRNLGGTKDRDFLIPCEFSGINTCNALADLGASINLMPYSVWKNLSLPELTPTCMTLELADRSISEPIGIAEDVYVTVGKFQFPADFVAEFSQEVLGFSNVKLEWQSHSYYDPIVSTVSPTLTPFGDSDFLLFEEANSFLAIEDDPTSPEVDPTYYDPDGDILLIEAKFLISHKRAIAWKLSDIKGINPEFCTHKILMEEDYEPTVQHQRRVNPKIHDVIKKEVEKLLDAGLIYPISDSRGLAGALCIEEGA
ncbi:reverse transcriptase domain-containing protein [Tanacetum coccineum]